MPKMRAKMKVNSVESYEYSERVKMTAVCGGSPEDNSYCAATPSGLIELTINNPDLVGKIKPGQKFYVDFTEAD